jgi:hypothetical protein
MVFIKVLTATRLAKLRIEHISDIIKQHRSIRMVCREQPERLAV